MNVAVELPEDIAVRLQEEWGDLGQHTLETLAVEGYRSGALTASQVRRMLCLATPMETDAFLKEHKAYLDYTAEDIVRDTKFSQQLNPEINISDR